VNRNLEDLVLVTIWLSIGFVGAFTLYATFSPRIQKPQQQPASPQA